VAACQNGLCDGEAHNYADQLLFGALISAVDPVATLSIMGRPELGVDPFLYSLVFGESVVNDAVSIVLFDVLLKCVCSFAPPSFLTSLPHPGPRYHSTGTSTKDIPAGIALFLAVMLGSVAIGLSIGLMASLIVRMSRSLHTLPPYEAALAALAGCMSYTLAEFASLSGIMAIFACSMALGHYYEPQLTRASSHAARTCFEMVAVISETIVFLYMGLTIGLGALADIRFGFTAVAVGACLLGRVFNIVPLSYVSNLTRNTKIPPKMQAVLTFAGLRGESGFAAGRCAPAEQ